MRALRGIIKRVTRCEGVVGRVWVNQGFPEEKRRAEVKQVDGNVVIPPAGVHVARCGIVGV
ncbi:MAG: hypothetical protein OEV08_08705 [Nitrospira sp.]|nr:hypothetical protein [Nitrospira sp.]